MTVDKLESAGLWRRQLDAARRYRPGRTMRRLVRDRVALASLGIIVVIVGAGALSLVWTPYPPAAQDFNQAFQGPGADHWLGTDQLGRDLLSRLMTASWTAVISCGLALGIAVIGGVGLGMLAATLRGATDWLLSRAADVFLSLPPLLFAVAVVGALGPGLRNAMIAIGALLLPRFFRLSRIATIEAMHEEYVEAARAAGATRARILGRHVLPNIASPLVTQISFSASVAIVSEASLSFLGLGAQPPDASWGTMTREGFDRLYDSAWTIVPPSVTIFLAVLAVSLLGDALRDASGRARETGR